jgi:hypothetical protein
MRKIAIVGFSDSRNQAPYADESWEIWGVNDLYAYVPRVTRIFEIHHLEGLAKRRNPNHIPFMQQTKIPIYMWDVNPQFPASVAMPREEIFARFGMYYTSSIAWMLALAIYENSCQVDINGRSQWVANPDCEIALFGIDMQASSEYASQRPAVEYYIGIAESMGFKVYVPDSSTLCKAVSIYGLTSTSPLRIKLQVQIEQTRAKKIEFMGQQNQLMANLQQVQGEIAKCTGAIETMESIKLNWTMPTDVGYGQEPEESPIRNSQDRGEPMEGSLLAKTDGQGSPDDAVPTSAEAVLRLTKTLGGP